MVPNLLVDPVANVRETSARVAYGKVLYPATQNRIDLRNHLSDRLGPMASKYLLELVQQRRPLLALRGTQRHPSASPTANPTELKAEKSEALTLREVHPPTLVLVSPRPGASPTPRGVAVPPPCVASAVAGERLRGPRGE